MRRRLAVILLVTSIIVTAAGIAVIAYAEGPSHTETSETAEGTVADLNRGLVALAAGIAVAGSTIASGIALGNVASAGFAASVERPEVTSYLLILGGLAEGIAIYGLLVAILLLGKI